jgi:hypothetical protein
MATQFTQSLVEGAADPDAVALWSEHLSDNYVMCRDMRHTWRPYTAKPIDGGYERVLRCARCAARHRPDGLRRAAPGVDAAVHDQDDSEGEVVATTIRFLCDVCLADGTETDGEPVAIGIDKTLKELEMCGPHRAQFLAPVEDLLRTHGRSVDKMTRSHSGARSRAHQAPQTAPGTRTHLPPGDRPVVCFLDDASFTSESGLRQHLTREHQTTVLGLYGHTCPLCQHQVGAHWNRHVSAMHSEFANVSRLFAWARDNGDPHGVVKERAALFG